MNNTINSNINSCDLLFLSNKELYNKMIKKKEKEHININSEVIKYKKEIKSKINKLLDNYLNNENMNNILKTKNENEKYKYNFYYFLTSLIENIKYQELKKLVSEDLSGVKNEFNINIDDISKSLLSIDMDLVKENSNTTKKINNLDEFVNIKYSGRKQKILPKKR